MKEDLYKILVKKFLLFMIIPSFISLFLSSFNYDIIVPIRESKSIPKSINIESYKQLKNNINKDVILSLNNIVIIGHSYGKYIAYDIDIEYKLENNNKLIENFEKI